MMDKHAKYCGFKKTKNKKGGEKEMKRIGLILFVAILAVGLVALYGTPAIAKVSGQCVNCHTMHNSQGGAPMNYDASATSNNALARGDCVGCHAQNTAANIVSSIPQVHHSNATDLPGGNFAYAIDDTDDTKAHNVAGVFTSNDGTLGNTPPGYSTGYDPSTTGFDDAERLSCAGINGCHGNRDEANEFSAISGAHHGDDAVLKFGGIVEGSQGASVATSYRFLYKVHGGEAAWDDIDGVGEYDSDTHNEYKGAVFAGRTSMDWAAVDTISELCAECHGNFHASGATGIGAASPWLKHPTDAILPNSGEYQYYNPDAANVYSVEAPVARATIPNTASSVVTPDTDLVMCLSCHRAHGSDYADILRWDYSTMNAGTGTSDTGCFTCHTTKNND
jgi:predicted CXXCH cytochrome family protein